MDNSVIRMMIVATPTGRGMRKGLQFEDYLFIYLSIFLSLSLYICSNKTKQKEQEEEECHSVTRCLDQYDTAS